MLRPPEVKPSFDNFSKLAQLYECAVSDLLVDLPDFRHLDSAQVVLEADLPAEAYEALVALDLSAFRQGPVHYDRQRGRWRSEPDEWQQRQG